MTSVCKKYCLEAIQLSDRLIQLSYGGNNDCDNDRCLVLFGIILDTGSRIRREAEKRLMEIEAAEQLEKPRH